MTYKHLAVVCLILCQAFWVSSYQIESKNEKKDVLRRLLNLLLAEEQKRQDEEACSGNLEDLPETHKWCFGARCTFEILDGSALLHIVYHSGQDLLEVEVTDMNFQNAVFTNSTNFELPFVFDFYRNNHDYRATVIDVSDVANSDDISACADLQEI